MSETITTIFTIETVERRTKPGLMPSLVFNRSGTADGEGWFGRVRHDRGAIEVSKLSGESDWTIDASYGPTGLPAFVNGYGARYLATRRVVTDVADALDAATEA